VGRKVGFVLVGRSLVGVCFLVGVCLCVGRRVGFREGLAVGFRVGVDLKGVLVEIGFEEGKGNGKHVRHRTRTVKNFGAPGQGSAGTPKDWRVTAREAEWRPRNVDETREEIVP